MKTTNTIDKAMIGLGFLFMAFSASANAVWNLDNNSSSLSFVSIKKDAVAEVHTFERLSGSVSKDGAVKIDIALPSVDTGISIRDERMRKMLFETELFPKAVVVGDIDMKQFSQLEAGQLLETDLQLKLSLHGNSKKFNAKIVVVKLDSDRFLVSTTRPVIIKAADFELVKGIEALRTVASLPSISTAVPVTFKLVFAQ